MRFLQIKSFGTKVFAFSTALVLLVVVFTAVNNSLFLQSILTKQFQSSIVDRTQLQANKIQTILTRIETKIGFYVQAILAIPEKQRPDAIKILLTSEAATRGLMIFKDNATLELVAEYFADPKEKIDPRIIKKDLGTESYVVSYHPTLKDLAWMGKKVFAGDEHGTLFTITIFKLSEIYSNIDAISDKGQKLLILNHQLKDLKSRRSYQRLLKDEVKDLKFIKHADEMLRKDLGSAYLGETPMSDESYMVAFHRFEAIPLWLVVHQSSAPIRRAIYAFVEEMVQWSVVFLLITILLAKGVVKGLLSSLQNLFQATVKVAAGDFSFRAQIKSQDEIGQLGQSFNLMTEKIVVLLGQEKEKARLDQELATANTVQNTFFNCDAYETPYLHLESFYKPASQCGGDWWGHFDLGQDRELVLIGDATGHGVPAALVTAIAYSVTHQFAAECLKRPDHACDPGEVLSILNTLLFHTLKGELYMSFAAFVFEPRLHRMLFANAGHPFPLKIARSTSGGLAKSSSVLPKTSRGGILGVEASVQYASETFAFLPGERIVIYTDGLTEVYDQKDKQWGKRGLTRVIESQASSPLPKLRDQIIQNCIAFNRQGEQFNDDVTFVVAENKSSSTQQVAA